ncbi:MAG: hypothetical protein EXR83_16015 [Gammaproteobacteria bacterium]|nr:hypothetical protein [Gammaproteobacteria bacterium]
MVAQPTAAAAAEDEAPKEPDDIGAVFRRLPSTGELTPLESRRARWAKRQQKVFTERDLLHIDGLASPIRFRRADRLEFVVRCLMQPRGFERLQWPPTLWRDPLNFELLRVDVNCELGLRELVLGQRGFINSNGSSGVFVYVRAWSDYSFLLRPGEALAPGEYAFKYASSSQTEARELFCFGIDA